MMNLNIAVPVAACFSHITMSVMVACFSHISMSVVVTTVTMMTVVTVMTVVIAVTMGGIVVDVGGTTNGRDGRNVFARVIAITRVIRVVLDFDNLLGNRNLFGG